MAKVDKSALHDFVNAETVTDAMLDQNFEVLRTAQNDTDDKGTAHKTASVLDHPDQSVTTAKIKDANVTTAKIADSSVTTSKIADGNVTREKIANGAVDVSKIDTNSLDSRYAYGSALDAHKLSGDHDTRYYPRLELDNKFSNYIASWQPQQLGKMYQLFQSIDLTEATATVTLNIPEYNATTDFVMISQNGMEIKKTRDYTISSDGKTITKVSGQWMLPTTLDVTILKSLDTSSVYQDGRMLQDGSVLESKLEQPFLDKIGNLSDSQQYINVKYPFPTNLPKVMGDGVTDDTVNTQALINYAIQNNVALRIPNGQYVTSNTLVFDYGTTTANVIPNGFKFVGESAENVMFLFKNTNVPAIKVRGKNNGETGNAGIELSGFTIKPFSTDYKQQFDGLVLENVIGCLFESITITGCINGLMLTTKHNASPDVGYTEQNMFESVQITDSVNSLTFRPDSATPLASFHGNMFHDCIFSVNTSVAVPANRQCTVFNFEGGYIYNCTFNIKVFVTGQNSYFMFLNSDSGTNVGTITYEVAGNYNPKIKTGDNGSAKFFLNGFIHGLGDVDWSEYKTLQVGELDYNNNKAPITSGSTVLGKDKFYTLNLIPPKEITAINLAGKHTVLKPFLNKINDLWSGITHYFMRYENTTGALEQGYIMACKETSGAGSRFILGTMPDNSSDIQNQFVPGFEFRSNGTYIKSTPANTWLTFASGKLQRNGTYTIYDTNTISETFDYAGSIVHPNGHVEKWGAITKSATGEQSFPVALTGLSACYQVFVTFNTNGTSTGTNSVSVSGVTSTGFTVYANTINSGTIYWRAYGKS